MGNILAVCGVSNEPRVADVFGVRGARVIDDYCCMYLVPAIMVQ